MKLSIAMVFVSDMSRSVRFYRDTIGLPLRFESPEWTEFDTEGAIFALHKSDAVTNSQPNEKNPGQCSPGFSVVNLSSFHERMLKAKVVCTQPPKNVFGTQIAHYVDPDGLQFGVSESAKNI